MNKNIFMRENKYSVPLFFYVFTDVLVCLTRIAKTLCSESDANFWLHISQRNESRCF